MAGVWQEHLLPAKVKPSSNTLIVCTHATSKGATVHYETKPSEEIASQDMQVRLGKLGDEAHNPNNELGVKEIHVRSTSFMLGSSVAIVDSPGLDARGLEAHEEMTLKLLLPTVDLAVFVTTAKANSDDQMLGYLRTINGAQKQMIVVQNMIDTVQAKRGPGGIEQKSKAQVAAEHMTRVRRILKNSDDPAIGNAPVIQVSARQALAGDLDASNVRCLVDIIESHLRTIAPQLENGRRKQLNRHLKGLLSQESAGEEDRERELNDEFKKLVAVRAELETGLSTAGRRSETSWKAAETDSRNLLARVQASFGSNEQADSIRRDVKAWQISVGSQVNTLLDGVLSAARGTAKQLNLRAEDYVMNRLNQNRSSASVEVEATPQVHYYKRKKSGALSWLARELWGGGYEECSSTSYTYHVRNVAAVVSAELHWMDEALHKLQEAATEYAARLRIELSRQERSVAEKRQNTITGDERNKIRTQLGTLITGLEREIAKAQPPVICSPIEAGGVREDTVTTSASLFAVKLCELANHLAARQCALFRDEILRRVAPPEARSRALFSTWDGEALDAFKQQFLIDVQLPSLSSTSSGHFERELPFTDFLFANHSTASRPDLLRVITHAVTKPATAFVMLDAQQSGSTSNQLHKSFLFEKIRDFAGVVIVIQSVEGLWLAPEFIEALGELRSLIKGLPRIITGILVNHPDVRISALVDMLLCNDSSTEIHKDEIRKLNRLGFNEESEPHETNFAAQVIRQWYDNPTRPV